MSPKHPIPAWIYIKLERWHHLSFLKSKETMDLLKSLRVQSTEADQIESLIQLVNEDLGFYLHSAVQRTKLELSAQEATVFSFKVPGISISSLVTRKQFESWIKEETDEISRCVDGLLKRTSVDKKNVDKVFLTGGSSFVPAVRLYLPMHCLQRRPDVSPDDRQAPLPLLWSGTPSAVALPRL